MTETNMNIGDIWAKLAELEQRDAQHREDLATLLARGDDLEAKLNAAAKRLVELEAKVSASLDSIASNATVSSVSAIAKVG